MIRTLPDGATMRTTTADLWRELHDGWGEDVPEAWHAAASGALAGGDRQREEEASARRQILAVGLRLLRRVGFEGGVFACQGSEEAPYEVRIGEAGTSCSCRYSTLSPSDPCKHRSEVVRVLLAEYRRREENWVAGRVGSADPSRACSHCWRPTPAEEADR